MFYFNFSQANTLSNEVVARIDVLSPCVVFRVASQGFSTLVIDMERNGFMRSKM